MFIGLGIISFQRKKGSRFDEKMISIVTMRPVPGGKTYQIKYRPLYTKYKVVQRQYYKIDGYSSATNNTKTCYVNVFYDWGFSYNVL